MQYDKNKILQEAEKCILQFKKICSQALQIVMEQDVSLYPVLVAHRLDVNLGLPLLRHAQTGSSFALRISTLEELVTKQIIALENIQQFKGLYRKHRNRFCVLVIDDLVADFVFIKSES